LTTYNIEKLGHEELYNLREDPEELNNLIGKNQEVLEIMRDKLEFYKTYCRQRAVSPSRRELDKETIRQLKALGYLQWQFILLSHVVCRV
jgi:hypothetical protein